MNSTENVHLKLMVQYLHSLKNLVFLHVTPSKSVYRQKHFGGSCCHHFYIIRRSQPFLDCPEVRESITLSRALIIEAESFSEILIPIYQTTRRNISENWYVYKHCCENRKPRVYFEDYLC